MKILKVSLIVISVFCISRVSFSRVYYVDSKVDSGGMVSKTAAAQGTEALPFKTIQDAANVASAGDRVMVREGTYNEVVTITHSGTAQDKVVFKADPLKPALINGAIIVDGEHVRVAGFHIDGAGARAGLAKTSGITKASAGVMVNRPFADVIDMSITDIAGPGIQFSSGSRVAGNYISGCQRGMVGFSVSNCIIENNEVERLFDHFGGEIWRGGNDCDYMSVHGSNITVRGNYFHNSLVSEIGQAHVDGIQGNYQTLLFERNIVIGFGQGVITHGSGNSNITVRNNIFVGGDLGGAWGVYLNEAANISGTVVVNNLFANIRWYGVGINNSTDCVVKNNIFYLVRYRSYQVLGSGTAEGGNNLLFGSGWSSGTGITKPQPDILGNPLFVDVGNDDYHLQAGSPAIDAGTDVGLMVDIEGNSRPDNGSYDIGPYEYDGVSGGIEDYAVFPQPGGCSLILGGERIYNVFGQRVDSFRNSGIFIMQNGSDMRKHVEIK